MEDQQDTDLFRSAVDHQEVVVDTRLRVDQVADDWGPVFQPAADRLELEEEEKEDRVEDSA